MITSLQGDDAWLNQNMGEVEAKDQLIKSLQQLVAKLNQDVGGGATKDDIIASLQQQLSDLQQLIGEDAAKDETIESLHNRLKAATSWKGLFEGQEKEMVALQQKVCLARSCLRFSSLMTLSLLSIR
jgi:predicted ArsR family transcriptional regulator